jgi:hypothetical protein
VGSWYRSTRTSPAGATQHNAELESALSGNIDTQDFTSGIIVPTEESLEQFKQHQKAFDKL